MKLHRSALALGLVAVLVWAGSSEAGSRKSGITGAAFLKVGVGARAVALGSAYTTITGDANQLFWNPAGIALSGGATQVTYSYNQWIADLGHHALGVTRDMGDMGTVGLGIVTLGLSGIDNNAGLDRDKIPTFMDATYTGNRDDQTGEYDYSDVALQLSWARKVTDKLALGLTGKWISEDIDGVTASAYAMDAGAIYNVGYRGARIGARINNLGSDLKFYTIAAPLPLTFSVGAAVDLYEMPDQGIKVTLLSDATKPQDGEQLLYSALEVQVMDYLSVRGGYKFNYAGVEDPKINESTKARIDAPRTEEGLTFGLGVNVPWSSYNATVDYAYTDFGILDSVHRVSLRVGL